MQLAVVGFGNAGGKITDELLEFQAATGRVLCQSVTAVNSAEIDLARLDHVPADRRVLIGQTDERVQGRGVGADPEVGAEVAATDRAELERALDDVPFHDVDAFLVVAGLGGGTGSGGAPVISAYLRETYVEPVYGLAVLPAREEGGRAALNAARTLQNFTDATDNLFLFDNEAWEVVGDSLEEAFERANAELVRRVGTLLSVGEIDGSQVAETAMDASDVNRTLATGGLSSIAYSSVELEPETRGGGLIDRFRRDGHGSETDFAMKVYSLVRKAVRSRMTVPAGIDSAERSLIVVSGPPTELSRKGLQRARQWLESETESVEVLAGDDPRESAEQLSAAVLLSNVTEVPRVDALQEQAIEAQDNIAAQAETRTREIEDLVTDEAGELDPI